LNLPFAFGKVDGVAGDIHCDVVIDQDAGCTASQRCGNGRGCRVVLVAGGMEVRRFRLSSSLRLDEFDVIGDPKFTDADAVDLHALRRDLEETEVVQTRVVQCRKRSCRVQYRDRVLGAGAFDRHEFVVGRFTGDGPHLLEQSRLAGGARVCGVVVHCHDDGTESIVAAGEGVAACRYVLESESFEVVLFKGGSNLGQPRERDWIFRVDAVALGSERDRAANVANELSVLDAH